MPANDPIVLGAICAIDKDSSTADSDTFGVVTAINNANAGNEATIVFIATQDDAKRVAAHFSIKPTPAAVPDAIKTIVEAGKSAARLNRARVQHLTTAGAWGDFFKPYVAGTITTTETDANPTMIGKKLTITAPILDAAGFTVGAFHGAAKVKSTTATAAVLEFVLEGATHTTTTSIAYTRKLLAEAAKASDPPAAVPIDFDKSSTLIELIRKLPGSRALPPTQICATEVYEIAKVLLPTHLLGTADSKDPSYATWIKGIVPTLHFVFDGVKNPSGRTWPDHRADRLAAEIRKEVNRAKPVSIDTDAPQPPPKHPRTDALRSLASSTDEWDAFIKASADITVEKEAHRTVTSSSNYLLTGAMEQYLARAGAKASPTAIKAHTSGLDKDGLLALLMFTFDSSGPSVASSSSDKPRDLAQQLKVTWSANDTTGTSDERSIRLTLRSDAEVVTDDPRLMAELARMSGHIAVDQGDVLYALARDTSNQSLKRLVSTEQDIDKALQGEHRLIDSALKALPQYTHTHTIYTRAHTRHTNLYAHTTARNQIGACMHPSLSHVMQLFLSLPMRSIPHAKCPINQSSISECFLCTLNPKSTIYTNNPSILAQLYIHLPNEMHRRPKPPLSFSLADPNPIQYLYTLPMGPIYRTFKSFP